MPLLLQAGEKKITPGQKFHLAIFCSRGDNVIGLGACFRDPTEKQQFAFKHRVIFRSPLFEYAEISLPGLLRNAYDVVSYFTLTQ